MLREQRPNKRREPRHRNRKPPWSNPSTRVAPTGLTLVTIGPIDHPISSVMLTDDEMRVLMTVVVAGTGTGRLGVTQ